MSNQPKGRRFIQFIDGDGQRKTIRLGKIDKKSGESFKLRIERLNSAQRVGGVPDDETARWVMNLPDVMHAKLAAVGLVKDRGATNGVTMEKLIDTFFEHLNVKPITVLGYQPTKASLLGYFGASISVRSIEPLKADQWRARMKADGLAEATISKRVKLARQIFRQAVRWKMLADNPFDGVKAGSQVNKSREFLVTQEMTGKVMAACPDVQWRLLFALARYAGMRCPSETLGLRWSDVLWDKGRLLIRCGKTEHHEGREERFTPIFPELRPHLLEAFEQAEPGTEYVISRYRGTSTNLRTQLSRIIRRAGLQPWPRLWQNLRSSRETELMEIFPGHVVYAWIGNSERVARKHYLQVTDDHFAKAVAGGDGPNGTVPGQRAAHALQQETELGGSTVKAGFAEGGKSIVFPVYSVHCHTLTNTEVAATGLEPVTRGL